MNAIALNDHAREWATALEDRESARTGVPVVQARRTVARRLEVAPGTLENLRKGRVKGVRAWLYERIRAALIREIEAEIARLTHELEMARRCGLDAGARENHALASRVAALVELMNEGA